jgi:hypothetical protein
MLACDLILEIRASRSVSAEQVFRLERMMFANGAPTAEDFDMLLTIDNYLRRFDPSWLTLLERARLAASVMDRKAA